MKKIICLLLTFISFNVYSNKFEDSVWISPDSYYLSKGKITTLLNQSQYSNWIAGGINNLSLTLLLDYDYTLKKGDLECLSNKKMTNIDSKYKKLRNLSIIDRVFI